jgi:glutamine---fructose-6-phosphate transaminase (isomerizing)
MCGISAYIGNNAVDHVFAALKALEIRGYDSAGIASWNGQIHIVKGTGYVENVFKETLPTGEIAIGHVRWATHGEVSQVNAHPHTDCYGRIAVCHNGVIENLQELKALLANRHKFQSETDTEIIAHLLENTDLITGMIKISNMLKGNNSFVVLSEGRILASCGGTPLLIAKGELASDASALTSREFLPMQRGDIVEIIENDFVFLRGTPGILHKNDWEKNTANQENSGLLTMFTQEIWEQPKAMQTALNNKRETLEWVARQMQKNVILTGAGSSKVACMWAKFKFIEAGINVEVIPVGDWLSRPIPETTTVIAVSQSGETGTLVSLVDAIRSDGRKLIAVVNTPWSFLARESDKVLQFFCGEERSVIASKSFMAECVVLGHIAAYASNNSKQFDDVVRRASSSLAAWLPKLQIEIDKLDIWFERCFVCGEGEFYPIAHEGSMKLKEGAYVFAEPILASELKHEALPLMTKDEVVLWVGETKGGGISEVAQIRARGAKVIGFSVENLGFDVHIRTPLEVIDFPPLAIVPFQLLTQHIANRKEINVDRPRNLAKAITVK